MHRQLGIPLEAVRRGFPGDPICVPAKVKIRLVERALRRIDVRRSKKLLLASVSAGGVLGEAPVVGGGVIIGRHHTCFRETSSDLTLPAGSATWTDWPLCSCRSGSVFVMGREPQGFPSCVARRQGRGIRAEQRRVVVR